MAAPSLHGLALCAGGGGIELGLRLALGARYRCVGYVERDAFAASTLVARMENQALDPAPVWDDLATFDSRPWGGMVDLVSAGFPCQPFSAAGRRAGHGDERFIWPEIVRVVREVGPDLVFLENSDALVTSRFAREYAAILGDLAGLGFHAEWGLLSASDLGGTHRRRRWWCLAYRDRGRLPQLGWQPGDDRDARGDADGRCEEKVGNTDRVGGRPRTGENEHSEPDGRQACHPGHHVADPGRLRERQPGHPPVPGPPTAIDEPRGSRGLPLFPPGRTDSHGWRRVLATDPTLEPSLRRVADGMAHRLDRLRVVGNGVVPLVAAAAFTRLVERAREELT